MGWKLGPGEQCEQGSKLEMLRYDVDEGFYLTQLCPGGGWEVEEGHRKDPKDILRTPARTANWKEKKKKKVVTHPLLRRIESHDPGLTAFEGLCTVAGGRHKISKMDGIGW